MRGASIEAEDVEDRCLDAEAWSEQLSLWGAARGDDHEASHARAIAAMLLALVRSIRLSLFADGSPVDRGYLIEELDSAIETARSLAVGTMPRRIVRFSEAPAPPAIFGLPGAVTLPPPPGKSPKEVWAQRSRDSDPPQSR